jgi:hypothetical protein
MKQRAAIFSLLILLGCVFIFFTGCDTEPAAETPVIDEDEDVVPEPEQEGSVFTIKNLSIQNGVKYISLSTGKEVPATKKSTTEWDIAVKASMFVFRTNSGATAADVGSTGQVRIYYTNKTDFSSVTLADKVDVTGTEYAPYTQDVTRYSHFMDAISPVEMNMMTFFGFNGGDGLSIDTAFESIPRAAGSSLEDYIFYHFDKKAAYKGTGGMPPGFKETNQIYIIQHADGVSYSKFQVTAFKYGYTMNLKFSRLN